MTLVELQSLKIWPHMPVKLQSVLVKLIESKQKLTADQERLFEAVSELEVICKRISNKADESTFVFLMQAAANEILRKNIAELKSAKKVAETVLEESGKSLELKSLESKI